MASNSALNSTVRSRTRSTALRTSWIASATPTHLDTGNSWLGGTNPVDLAKKYHDKIYHIHWKDLGPEWLPKRGTIFGCGFSTIEVGTGCIDVAGVIEVLKDNKNIKYSTLEVGGSAELLRASAKYIEDRWNA